MINLLHKKTLGIFIFIYLISSINSPLFIPDNTEPITILNFLRSLSPLIISAFLLILFFFNKFKLSKSSIIFIILILSQIIGFLLNDQRKIYDLYWLICSISLVLFLEYYCNQLLDIKKIILVFISLIFIVSATISYFIIIEIFENYQNLQKIFNTVYASDFMSPNTFFIGQPVPRSSGYARFLMIIFLFLLPFIFFSKLKKKNYRFKIINTLIILLLAFISIFFWKIQNRSSLYFYIITGLIFLYLVIQKKNINKIFIFIIIFILPYLIYQAEINYKKNFINSYLSKTKDSYLSKTKESNLLGGAERWNNPLNTSGRLEIWKSSLKIIKQNFFFGLGPQTDRHKLDISASNILIYLFLCGGFLTVLIFFIYKFYLTVILFKFFKKNNIFEIGNDKFIFFSILIFFFMNFRGIVENSYSLYGIDMVAFLLAVKYLELSYRFSK
jgi:O-antigen ligase